MKVIDTVVFEWDYEDVSLIDFICNQQKKLTPQNGQLVIIGEFYACCHFDDMKDFISAEAKVVVNAIDEYRGRVNGWDIWENKWMPEDELWLQNNDEMIKIKFGD